MCCKSERDGWMDIIWWSANCVCVRVKRRKNVCIHACVIELYACVCECAVWEKRGKYSRNSSGVHGDHVCVRVFVWVELTHTHTHAHTVHQIDFSMYVKVLRHYRSFSCVLSCSLSTYQIFQAFISQTHFTFTVMNHRHSSIHETQCVRFKITEKNP